MDKKIFISLITVATMLSVSASAQMVKVTEHTAITKPFTKKVKIGEQCYDDTVEVDVACGNSDTNSIGVDTLIGATLGVVLGNQVGGGNGRAAAKIIGGLGGAAMANNMRVQKCKTYETVTRCNPKYEFITQEKTIGYNNCAIIDGQKYCKQTKEPIEYLKIKKTISIY